MPLFQSTAAAQTRTNVTGSDIRTQADLTQYINVFFNELEDNFIGEIDASQLMKYFREGTQKNDAEVTATKVKGHNVAGINEDGDDLPFIQWGQGWPYTWNVFPYRIAAKHTRHLEEIENFGTIADEAMEMSDSGKRTIFYALADALNRGIAPANAPFTCYDGMYLIDAGRPNPVVGVPDWSNQEAITDLTEDALFTASLNTRQTIAHNGDELDLDIESILIPIGHDQVMWQLDKSRLDILGGVNNTMNWAAGRFKYETVRQFTGNTIYYILGNPKSRDNGLEIRWAVRPNVADINFEDPDVIGKRLRFRFGIGCLDPRKMFRGGLLNAA
jgi:hypothetical protein